MKIQNNGRTLMLPGITASDTSEALPTNPHQGDEVVAINSGGAHNYTLTGTIDGVTNLALPHGESVTLIYASGGWLSVQSSTGGQVAPGGVSLQVTTPGTPDAGNFNISGKGIATSFSVRNDSHTDGASVSKLCLSDTNAATTLSNACIVFQPQAGAAGDLVAFVGGADNDTPGFEVVRFLGLDGSIAITNTNSAVVFSANVSTVTTTIGSPGAGVAAQIVLDDSQDFMGTSVVSLLAGGTSILNSSSGTYVTNLTTNHEYSSISIDDSLPAGGLMTFKVNGSEFGHIDSTGLLTVVGTNGVAIGGKLAVGSTTIGSHQLDVTGDVAVTGDMAAATFHAGATPGVTAGPFTAITSIQVIGGIVTTLTGT